MGGHLQRSSLGSIQDLEEVDTVLLKCLELEDIVCDSLQLILECLGISWNLVTLGQKILLCLGIGLEDLKLSSNVFLEVHCSGNSVFWEHGTRCFLDVLELSSSSILPGIKGLKGVVKGSKGSNKP